MDKLNGIVGIIASERNNFSWYFVSSLLGLKDFRPELKIVHSHAGTIPDGRNAIIDIAKKENADFVVMIDSDMTFTRRSVDVLLESMEKFDAQIGCGIYFGTCPPFVLKPMAFDADENGIQTALEEWKDIKYIRTCGMGFTIIKKELFDIKFEFRPNQGEDHLFCKEAEKRGAKIILNPHVKCGHLRMIPLNEQNCHVINTF